MSKANKQYKCTHCRMARRVAFEKELSFSVQSGLVAQPEVIKIRLCTPCLVEFARTQMLEINIHQANQLAGRGNKG